MPPLTDTLGVSLVSQDTLDALDSLGPLHTDDYHGFKEDFLTWLANEGKKPVKGIGYEKNTIIATHYKIDAVFRWLWEQNGVYATTLEPDDADDFCNQVMKEQSDELTADYMKALKRYFAYRNANSEREIEWDFENKNELNLNATRKSIDYFRHQEMAELYQATLEYGSFKSYNNKNMSPDERDRLKILLAQRLEMPKHQE